jgi:hypothetical protein
MPHDPILVWSGQLWKLRMGAIAVLVGSAITGIGVWGVINDGATLWVWAYLSGLTIGIVGGAWSAGTIRCPSCGARLLWDAVHAKAFPGSLGWLLAVERCPTCGAGEEGVP